MKRLLMGNLVEWKNSARRKPLVLNGARQVGKTWLLKEFGRSSFGNVAYVNFDNNPSMQARFDEGYDTRNLLAAIQAESRERIVPGETLVVLDEIQECPKALTSLKYFCENVPDVAIAAAGSLIGLAIHQGTGYPVGKVDMLNLYPLSFREFLDAVGEEMLRELVDTGNWRSIDAFSSRLTSLLRQYYFVGGMPEAVSRFAESKDFSDARAVQTQILQGFERDMSKHLTGREAGYALAAWNSVPAHLGRENKRFIFGHIKESARARDYRFAITWLTQAGLAYRVPRVSKPSLPLAAYADDHVFKLFVLDVGLLGAMSGLDQAEVIESSTIFTEFKGALAEQYVCQQLISECCLTPFYWSAENSRGEVDFLVQSEGKVYPVEVKAEENLQAKSLRAFSEKYGDVYPVRLSLSGFRDEGWMRNVPLYALPLFLETGESTTVESTPASASGCPT